jgi:hypothetical protein
LRQDRRSALEERTMRLALIAAFLVASSAAYAETACKQQASDKKLAGAAKTSFVKKCQSDAVGM